MRTGSLHGYMEPSKTLAFKVPYLRHAEQILLIKIFAAHAELPFELVTFISNNTRSEDAGNWDFISAGTIRSVVEGFRLRGLVSEVESESRIFTVGYCRMRVKLTPRALRIMQSLDEYAGLPMSQRRLAVDVLLCFQMSGKKKYRTVDVVKDLEPCYPIPAIVAMVKQLHTHFGFTTELGGKKPGYKLTPEGQVVVDAIKEISDLF